jgi:hypothetical protein
MVKLTAMARLRPTAVVGTAPMAGEVTFRTGVVGRAVASALDYAYSNQALPARGYKTWTKAAFDADVAGERTDVIACSASHDAGRE